MTLALVTPSPAPLERHPAAVYLASVAQGSIRSIRRRLDVVADLLAPGADAHSLPWERVRYQHAQAVRTALMERYAPATANAHLSALRGVAREAWRLGLLPADDYQRIADVEDVRGSRLPKGREVPQGELAQLLATCDTSPKGIRDRAVISLLYVTGMRRSEVAGLDAEDLDRASGSLRLRGKGNKERLVYAAAALPALLAWLEARGEGDGPLFLPARRGGRLEARRMSAQAILEILQSRAAQAGLASLSPHDLRRTCIGDLLDAGADISAVADLMGHAGVQTTRRYDRRGERAKKAAAGRLTLPG